jgi:probable phosphoglycerate mutase
LGWNRTGREMGLLAFGLSLGDRDWMDQSPAALNLLDFVSPVRARLRLFNDVSHDEGIPDRTFSHRLLRWWSPRT